MATAPACPPVFGSGTDVQLEAGSEGRGAVDGPVGHSEGGAWRRIVIDEWPDQLPQVTLAGDDVVIETLGSDGRGVQMLERISDAMRHTQLSLDSTSRRLVMDVSEHVLA